MELDKSNIVAEEVKQSMAKRHHYNPEDKRALFVNNNLEEFSRTNAVMVGISMFIWIIGIGTIIAGVVGISNIMLISVKERRKEIGIRKAIGARPRTIIAMILMEAIIITAVAGYIGMLAGVGTLHLLGTMLPPSDVFVNPQADINIAIAASVLLVVSGALAGYFPARSAAKIQPVEALHYE
jgi:putative ABC transport system permease protein